MRASNSRTRWILRELQRVLVFPSKRTSPGVFGLGRARSLLKRAKSSRTFTPPIAKQDLHPGLRNRLLRLAAFQNPEFYIAQAMRLSTYNKPRVVACAEDLPYHIGLPRGCLDDVRKTLHDLGVR